MAIPFTSATMARQAAELRAKGAEMVKQAEVLEAAFGIMGGPVAAADAEHPDGKEDHPAVNGTVQHKKAAASGGGVTRLDQLRAYLKKHGPQTRGEILKGCGMPSGTANVLLKPDNFVKTDDGKWAVE